MKILIRILGLSAVGLFCMLICLQLINIDVRRDEMNTISTLAMTQTQTILEEQIADEIYGTNTNRKQISSNQEYFQEYVNNFQKLVTTDCQYQLELMDADYKKGLLDVNVICRYRNLAGQEQAMNVRKTNIIEAVDNSQNGTVIPFYDIIYELQRGRVIGKNPIKYNENTNPFELINPTRTGYTFKGWTGSNGEVPQMKVVVDTSKKENLIYVANYDMATYNIIYDLNGGTLSKENPKTYTIETDTFTLNNPTKPHYDFKGWTGSNGRNPSTKVTITRGHYGNRTYKAVWDYHKYGINYVLNGGSNHVDNPKNYTINDANITLKNPTKYGYNFQGWYEDSSFTKPITTINTQRAENITIYAKWTPKKATITFNSNNGTGQTVSKEFVVGDNPANHRLIFPNWTKKGYNPVSYSDSQGRKFDLTQLINTQWIIDHEGNQTLNVNWTAKKVDITIHANNGTGQTVNKTIYYDGANQNLPSAGSWSRPNHTAIYYSYSNGGGKAFDMNHYMSNDWIIANEGKVTLHVVWKVNILYGYQTVTAWNNNFQTSIPSDGFYTSSSRREGRTFNQGQTNSGEATAYSNVGAFVPESVSIKGWCHTGECRSMEMVGYSNSVGWQVICSGYQGRGGGMSCSSWRGEEFSQFRMNCTNRGSNGYDIWNGSACTGTAPQWYGYQISGYTISGYVNRRGYVGPASWSGTTQMPNYNSYSKTNNRRLVYSRDGGASWQVCSNNGASCPTS